jgi:hypothetical protein
LVCGESLITRCRNELVDVFLKSDYTHFLSIDDDIIFQVEDVMKLLKADKEVIGATYRLKKEPVEYVVNALPGITSTTEVSEVAVIGTGLLMIKRKVFDALKEAYPEYNYVSDTGNNKGQPMFSYFNVGIREGRTFSEDWCICDDYRKIGGKVFIEPTIRLGHVGFKVYN